MATGARLSGKRRAAGALFLLSLLWALDGLGPDLFPALRHSPMSAMERQAVTFAVLAMLAAAYARKRCASLPVRQDLVKWAAIGLLLFTVPALITAFTQGWVSQLERVAIFSLTPVFAVVFEPHLGSGAHRGSGGLTAALAGVAGALCIFPLSIPGTPGAAAAALALVLAVACLAIGNCIAVHLASSHSGGALAFCAAFACGSAAVVFAVASAITEHAQSLLPLDVPQLVWLVIIDVPALILLFWLLREMSAVRMTARFILAPLLTILAGIALEQPAVTTRMVLGVALMGAGSMWLVFAPDEVSEKGTFLNS